MYRCYSKSLRYLSLACIILFGFITIIGSSNGGGDTPALDNRFTDMRDGTVRDNDSGLIWLKNTNAFGKMNWDDAMSAAATLKEGEQGLTDGSSEGDWRLPDPDQWEEFADTSYSNPALCNAIGDSKWVEGDAFVNVQSEWYWSNTLQGGSPTAVNMSNGELMSFGGGNWEFFVWPVRRSFDRFTDMGDGTVRDNDSGLIWLKNANAFGKMNWDDAMSAAATLKEGEQGLTDGSSEGDWRLANKEEWLSFVDICYTDPVLSNTTGKHQHVNGDPFYDVMTDSLYWTSDEPYQCDCGGIPLCGTGFSMSDAHYNNSYCAINDFYLWPVR